MAAVPAREPASIPVAASRRRRLPLAYLVAASVLPLILLAILGWRLLLAQPVAPAAGIGSSAPGFTLTDLDGKTVSLADLRGHPVIVNFWASWCGPCIEEFPLLQQAASAHAADGLRVVGIVYADRADAARAFMAKMGADWPTAMDPGARVAADYGIYAPPDTFFIDRNGVIAGRQIGQLSQQDLARQLDTILGKE
jgi:cytochrome c biogenesis protein CcmG/thiol:disulfide interchange protein DsbE